LLFICGYVENRLSGFFTTDDHNYTVCECANSRYREKDTVKIDSNLLNKYRIQSKKNAIPVPPTPIANTAGADTGNHAGL
jgi:hypothetical protein